MFCKEAIEALELMKDQWRLSLTDAIVADINFLIMELKFLDIFLRLQSFTTDSNLLDVSEHIRAMVSVVGSDLKSLFSAGMVPPDQKFDLTLSEVQEKIRICKSEIKAQYSYPQVVNISDASPTSIAKLIGDVIETINYVVSTPLASSLSISPQIRELFCALSSPQSLCYMLAVRKLQDSSQMTFFTHAIAVTCHAAMIIFLHFPEHNKVNQETDINSLLTDFVLKRIFPIQPCVRRIYVELLQSFMSGPQLTWRHAVLAKMETMFTLFLKTNLLMLQFSYRYGLIVPLEDQNQMDYFFEMLDYLGTYLEDLPPQGFGSKLREIDNLMVNAALFIFSLYGNEEDVASGEVNQEATLDLPGLIQRISALTYQIVQMSFQSILPRIDGLGFVDFLLVNMKEFLNQSADTLPSAKSQLEAVLKYLEFLHPFLRDAAAEKCINHDRLQHLATVVIGKAYEIEYIVDCFVTKDVPAWFLTPWLSDLIVEIEFLKAEVEKIKEDKACDAPMENITNASNVATSSQSASMLSTTEEMVGFEDVVQTLRNQLVGGTSQLDVVSVVGTFGQGKTTVAKKLFYDESIASLFDVHAKCFLPVVYLRRDLLVAILSDVVDKKTDLSEVPEDELADKLHKILLQRKYLILVDDVRETVVLDFLESCFPDANNGSRIILTTELDEVANYARRVSSPYRLRLFSDEEIWMLLQNKVFLRQSCPPYIRDVGQKLVKTCPGLPLAVVMLANALAKLAKNGDHVNFSEEAVKEFNEILENQRSSYVNVSSQMASTPRITEEITDEMVGFDDVLQTLRDQLVRVTPRELDIISIVGTLGQGKTTVANKLFTDELVVSLFDVRAKCFVPAAFQRRELLVAILRNLVEKTIDLSEAREDELADELHKLLLPKRYLLLIDNVNDSVAWDYLRSCFPDANNGSRILLTTRLDEVATKARRVSSPHYLRLFTDEESWTLLQNKAFPRQSCPPNFRPLAEQLAKRCEGSPVQVVVLAGVLAKMTTKELELLAEGDKGVHMVFIKEVEKKAREATLDQARGSRPKSFRNASQGHISSQLDWTTAEDMVGFTDVMRTITNLLVRGTSQRDVISIVGMAGQGKTTIANKLFIDESVVLQFDVRAKCYVSQVYNRREVLVSILSDVVDKPTDLSEVPEDELADKLRRLLLSKRYLILIDDVWETRAWDELQTCFPDTNNSSRIMLTTRLEKVATYASCVSSLHHLRLFSEDESWTLLQKKVFLQQSCPPDLEGVGQEIAKKCGRLPLSIVLVAGVLASMTKKEQWEQVADGLGSHIRGDSKHIIQFSYKNLPHYLKPCFLYFGAFLEDKEIQISKLMKLWMAEGLVVKQKERCLADIAEDYLEDLIRRNMVMATKNRYLGKVKACRIHDLLLEFCKEKAKDEKFLLWIYRDQDANSAEVLSRMLVQRRISIYSKQHNLVERSPSCSNVHSILFRKVGDDVIPSVDNQVSFAFHSFKCLRVLDLEFVTVDSFPTELSQLRYLALRTFEESIPSSIANLRNLETLMVKGLGSELSLPHSLCKMVKIRHLHLNDRASFNLQNIKVFLEDPSELGNLETFSTPAFSSGEDVEKVLSKTPNIRKLRCIFSGSWGYSEEQQKDCNQFPRLQHLTKLESLKVFCFHKPERSPCVFNFPSDLKKLTLCGFGFPWSEISAISTLPNLVILKLQSDAFCGEEWEVSDEQFSQLKVLKLENISFACWSVSEDAFSNLEQLVLHSCDCLVEIPTEFGYFTCLQSIEVKSCQESVANSARNVEEIQVEEMQNNGFTLFIY
ncbi:uncharacterized protein [Nicotiana sylvestris]|uniref:Late blight resistance protein homolog R1B-23 n=1 Tax=Nicotiana sylvestris TaxID=4096 RepID=A0A1U7VM91_NICSY|nr:PREDICTED: putative late blight resistance protein homolog R1B-23 [Nicotiana sylvestris]